MNINLLLYLIKFKIFIIKHTNLHASHIIQLTNFPPNISSINVFFFSSPFSLKA